MTNITRTKVKSLKSGIFYNLEANEYFADPALGSTSIKNLSDPDLSMAEVHQMITVNEHKKVYEAGTLGHALILEGSLDNLIERVPFDSYRTKDAREARDAAYAAGLIPVNDSEVETVLEPVGRMRDAVMTHSIAGPLFNGHEPEVSAFWEQDGVPMKARFDAYHQKRGLIVDLKCLASARPSEVQKAISNFGYWIQRRHYLNGAAAVTGFEPDWLFVVVQKTEPYTVSVHRMNPNVDPLAQARIDYAVRRYREASMTGIWPGYNQIFEQGLTPWERIRTEEMESMQ